MNEDREAEIVSASSEGSITTFKSGLRYMTKLKASAARKAIVVQITAVKICHPAAVF